MKKSLGVALLLLLLSCAVVSAEGYLVVEGAVPKISGTSLVIKERRDPQKKEQLYPISPFVLVYDHAGAPSSLAAIANIGRVSRARIYVLQGKVEKIVIEEQLQ